MRILTYCFFVLCLFDLKSQKVTITNFKINNQDQVDVDFYVDESHSSREIYEVSIYTSIDGFSQPIAYKIKNVSPGKSTRASFSGSEQLGKYEGQLQLKLVATAESFPIKVNGLDKGLKIGKNNRITWFDYHDVGPYDVSLYQGTLLKSELATGVTGTSYEGKLPKSLAKGNYELVVTPTKDRQMASEQYPVLLKKGINPLIYVGVAALAGGGAVLAGGGGSDAGGGTGSQLPDPPGPPSGN